MQYAMSSERNHISVILAPGVLSATCLTFAATFPRSSAPRAISAAMTDYDNPLSVSMLTKHRPRSIVRLSPRDRHEYPTQRHGELHLPVLSEPRRLLALSRVRVWSLATSRHS